MRSRQLRQTSVCQFSTCFWSLPEDLSRLRTYGFDSIGIWRRKLEDHGLEAAIDLLFESRLNVTSLHWAGGFTGDGLRLDDALEDTRDAIKLAATINAGCLLIHPGAINSHIKNHANRLIVGAFERIVPFANDLGVQLVIEPVMNHPNSPWTFHTSLDDSLRLLDRFPSLGINLDLYHVGLYETVFERLNEFVGRVKLVQLGDRLMESLNHSNHKSNRRLSYRVPLGEGDTNLDRWMFELNRLGYLGPMEIELHGNAISDPDHFTLMDQTCDYLRGHRAAGLSKTRRHAASASTDAVDQRVIN